jgi:hypothetical protein
MNLVLLADSSRTYYQLSRLETMDQWWHWMVLSSVCLTLAVLIGWLYVRDTKELAPGKRWLLLALRVLALVGLLFFFLDLEKRTEQELVKNSRLLMLIDTSQSMGLAGTDAEPSRARIDQVADALDEGTLLSQLQAQHDVLVYRFDQGSRPVEIASLAKRARDQDEPATIGPQATEAPWREMRLLATATAALLVIALAGALVHWRLRSWVTGSEGNSWALLVSAIALVAATVTMAVCHLRNPGISLAILFGDTAAEGTSRPSDERRASQSTDPVGPEVPDRIAWQSTLSPRGTETRLGDALEYLVDKERGGPIAGIVLCSDGQSNAGSDITAAVDAAQEAAIPVYAVGLGSEQRPAGIRVVDLEAPARVFPGDHFTITSYLQATGLEGRSVKVTLSSSPREGGGSDDVRFEQETRVRLGPTGEVLPVPFDITPEEHGRRNYRLRVEAPPEDENGRDNEATASVDIVDRKNRVLLMAGGPTREFSFLRNQLYRDRDVTLDVWLQTGRPGASQESHNLLFQFPTGSDDLFQYDCIVAFDPNWEQLDVEQVQLLDRWVAEQAGGLVLVAGPVNTPNWAHRRRGDPRLDTLRGLYPVTFYRLGASSADASHYATETPWPLEFTNDGAQADFLWLDDTRLLSEQAWDRFVGVFSYFPVRGEKPGATVYARFSDPQKAIDDQLPVYLAGHFYGAGRVFYQASGEMWRLREIDEAYFEQYYTKLIRYVSQGRLLRDSSHGVLLVDKDRCLLGDTVVVRASLSDTQFKPLKVPHVTANVVGPDGARHPITLRQVEQAAREGMYAGQFTVLAEGVYRVELAIPATSDQVILSREVRARLPDLEIERPERNDALLSSLARRTGGSYYVGMPAALGQRGVASLASTVAPNDQRTYLPATHDRDFEFRLMSWLMGLLCGVLSFEWLVRRLNRLA